MYVDKLLQFSAAQALTATAVSTNVIDLGLDRDIGIGEPMAAVAFIKVAADFTAGNETYKFTLQTATDAAFTSAVTVVESGVINGDELALGKKVVLPMGHTNLRYLRVNYTLAGTTPTATVDTYLSPLNFINGEAYYASGFVV
tara:strand:+ start:69 stop:497 length:429 start_codon:yes stop_codon:yes gene_type:complete